MYIFGEVLVLFGNIINVINLSCQRGKLDFGFNSYACMYDVRMAHESFHLCMHY